MQQVLNWNPAARTFVSACFKNKSNKIGLLLRVDFF
jgi:hypothetical protein